jgi:hypothetical protein
MDSDADQSTSKRKRASSTSSGPCKRAKGRKPQASNTLSRSTVNRDLDAADTPSDSKALRSPQLEEIAKAKEELAVRLYVTYNLYKQEAKSENICLGLMELTRGIGSMMSSAIMNHDKLASESPMRDRSELAMAIQASTRAWACLIVGLKKLSDGVEISLPRLVIVECVNMFNTLFNSIFVCARQMANSQAASRFRGGTSGREADPTSREIGIFRSAAQFLNALISSLNKDDCHHRDIFEGVLFLLIERIGNNLFYFTFNHRRKPTIEGDIAMSAELELDRNGPSQSTEIISLRLEVQCLTPVLERAMGLAPYHMNMPTSSRPSSASSRRPSSATRSPTKALPRASAVPLVTHARNRLQRTLIQSMFGETQDDELSDVLRKPGRIGPMPKFSKIEENDVGDWFTREIWRVLGWSIISNESEV